MPVDAVQPTGDAQPTGARRLLEEALRRSGLTARGLSRRAGISEGRLSDYLSGRHDPGSTQLLRLLTAAGARLVVVPDRDPNGLILAELMDLADAVAVDQARPRRAADPPPFATLVRPGA